MLCSISEATLLFASANRLSELIETMDARLQRKSQNSRLFGMAHINARNKQRNFENALKNVGARPEGSTTKTADGSDPFSRRRTRPQLYWSTKKHNPGMQLNQGFHGPPCCLAR